MSSAVLIIPAQLQSQADAVGEAMGWGPKSYTVALSTDGETLTHYGCRADVSEQFIRWIKGIDPLPEGMEAAQPVIDALIYDFRPDPTVEYAEGETSPPTLWGRAHFDAVLADNGLAHMPKEDETWL